MSDNDKILDAVRAGDAELIREQLVETPDLVSLRDDSGATPLHLAVLHGQRLVADLLLESGAHINARDPHWDATPTGWAIEYLRSQGGLLGIEIDDAFLAVQRGDTFWLQRFVSRFPSLLECVNAAGQSLLECAEQLGNSDVVKCLQSVQQVGNS